MLEVLSSVVKEHDFFNNVFPRLSDFLLHLPPPLSYAETNRFERNSRDSMGSALSLNAMSVCWAALF